MNALQKSLDVTVGHPKVRSDVNTLIQTKATRRCLRTHQALHKKVSHLNIQSRAPPNLEKASAEEEETINQNIRSSFLWSFPQEKSYVNNLGSLWGSKIAR